MTTARAYAAPTKGAALEPTTIERRDLRERDVEVTILYSGICHSDIHQARGEWGGNNFPMVPGHEIAGVVAAIGSGVTKFKVGDRVGVGVIVDSCRECENCEAGLEQYCLGGSTGTYNVKGRDGEITQGGYSSSIVADDRFVHHIPDGLPLDKAAPLLCAGITVWSPLKHWGAGPGKAVAVVGMGGLGHMAVQFAHALGARVTVLSQSLSKRDDGLRLGADEYYATSDEATFKDLRGRFDLIINTVSASLDVNRYLGLLATSGVFVNVGLPVEPISVGAFPLIIGRKSLAGSSIGGMPETQEMLDFCGEHGIGAEVEVIPAAQINEAYERVDRSDVRFRFVIDGSTF